MYKTIITTLSLGLLWTSASINASSDSFKIAPPSPLITISSLSSPLGLSSLSTPLTSRTDSSTASLSDSIFTTQSTISSMSKIQRVGLVKKLDSKQTQLASIIPEEKIEAENQKGSCCFIFWRSCFRISSKTLGSLAIDIVLDLSDGKLDGKGPNGSIDYIHHLVEIINATIEEVSAEASKPKK